jgi:hypothetical protein
MGKVVSSHLLLASLRTEIPQRGVANKSTRARLYCAGDRWIGDWYSNYPVLGRGDFKGCNFVGAIRKQAPAQQGTDKEYLVIGHSGVSAGTGLNGKKN